MRKDRPSGLSKRDLLCGILVAALSPAVGDAKAVEIASTACEPLFESVPPGERWFPVIDKAHARLAIHFATRACRFGAITQDECDWVCAKARRVILADDTEEGPHAA